MTRYGTAGRLGHHASAGNFAHAGLGHPNFTRAGGRRALNGADLEGLAGAWIARVAARDATIYGATGDGVALILPATGNVRDLASVGLRNHDGAGDLAFDGLVARTHDRVGALTLFRRRYHDRVVHLLRHGNPVDAIDRVGARALFRNRYHDRVGDFLLARAIYRLHDRVGALTLLRNRHHDRVVHLLRNRVPIDAIDRISARALLGNRYHDRVRNFLLALFNDAAHDRVGALTLLDDRLHNGVVHLLRNRRPDALVDRVGARALLGNRYHDRVRNFLLAGLVNDAIDRARNRLRHVLPNCAVDRIGNLARLTLRYVPRARYLTRNRHFLNAIAIANNLFFFKNNAAAGLHDRVALRGEFTRGRTASGIGTRAAVGRLRLLQRERCQRGNR